ncbi:ATP-binding protein [Spirillospora sp. CA-294931]|uniref:ATP-binding protein n=1 Tax=Spirillospora sp. CA-294931 TaxID=3240042 RepID=UPI003D8C9B9A
MGSRGELRYGGGRLPSEVTSFVGRRTELAEVRRLLRRSRLVTLAGPGGVGKTRLAVRTGLELEPLFADGARFADLASLREGGLLAHTLCDTLGLPGPMSAQPGDPLPPHLADHLADKQLLLILDTCEHLVDTCALLVEALLLAAPRLCVLVTSRQPLDVPGEHLVQVPPLACPDEAVTLFADRARAVDPSRLTGDADRATAARICRRLDGMPLAIELAAVQLRTRSLDEVADGLDERLLQIQDRRGGPVRHRSMRAVIEWSHELCFPEERLLWAWLSVFAGDFDLEVAEYVCADLPGLAAFADPSILDALSGLVDKSIVQRVGATDRVRYRMLGTVREYGTELLDLLERTGGVRDRHRDWYAGLAERAREGLTGTRQPWWLERLRAEQADLRAALDHALRGPGDGGAVRMVLALARFWLIQGSIGEARHWVERVLHGEVEDGDRAAELTAGAAMLALLQCDLDAARPLIGEARSRAETENDDAVLAYAITLEGIAALYDDRPADSLDLLARAARLHLTVGTADVFALSADVFAAGVCCVRGDLDRARELSEAVIARSESSGELWCRSYALWVRGVVAWLRGEPDLARSDALRSLRINRELGDLLGTAVTFDLLGGCAAAVDDHVRAARLRGVADRSLRQIGATTFGPGHIALRTVYEQVVREALGDERFGAEYAAGATLEIDAAVRYALSQGGVNGP